jgi:pyruvate,water dikinase
MPKVKNLIFRSESREGMQECCENVAQKFCAQKLPQIIENQLRENLRSIFGENYQSIQFAVRSSASGEDSEEMSAAGQMTTYLGVKGIDEICSAVMKCWSSQFSFVAVEYKRGYGQEINSPMAVVIQEMINCDSAGVIFTCDPLTGDERKIIITANYGIGESVVSAMAEPDTIRLDVNIEANSLQKQRTIKGIIRILYDI